jgi:hypothetical protein
MESIEFVPHSQKQEDVIFSDEDITLASTGTQWGKSTAGALWMKRKIHEHWGKGNNFIVTAPTYKIMEQSALPAFLHFMEGYGKYNDAKAKFELHVGGTIYFRTGKDPDSVVGIPNAKAIWCDEAGKFTLYFWENIQGRQESSGCPVLLTTSPYALNWVYKDIIRPWQKGNRDGLNVIQAASWENPGHALFDEDRRRRKKATMDTTRFEMVFGGQYLRAEGLVYNCWDDELNVVTPFKLPDDTKYVGGIDWGFKDPFVIKVRAITPDGRHYGVSEFYKARLTPTQQIDACKQIMSVWGVEMFYADPSQPGQIEEMGQAGVPVVGADNDIRRGVGRHYEMVKTRRYKEFIGACPNSADERETYHYPEPKDLKPDQDAKEALPVDADNHCCDVDRYLSIMTYRSEKKLVPSGAGQGKRQETQRQRLKRLRRLNYSVQTEEFS